MGKTQLIILFSLIFYTLAGQTTDSKWYLKSGGEAATTISNVSADTVNTSLKFPGSFLIFQKRDRKTFRPNNETFSYNKLSIDVKVDSEDLKKIQANLFIKDKDGFWFQSQKDFKLQTHSWQTLSVDLCKISNSFRPVGHRGQWNSHYSVTAHSYGISVYSNTDQKVELSCKNLKFSGKRQRPKLKLLNWHLPIQATQNKIFESTFELNREYLNPYNPDEIKVDAEVTSPDGKKSLWPAFYIQDFSRELHFTKERLLPLNRAHWAFRYTPTQTGDYTFKLIIQDGSGEQKEELTTTAKKLNIVKSANKGFVKTSPKNSRYFAFSNGEIFYPIGFNIHTPKDLRSEKRLKLGHIPNTGTYAYDEYFEKMAENGINATEIWMASWSLALEWTSAQRFYYGMGRYNQANAWRLDHILQAAKDHGIYVHLVLDNHGKLSSQWDVEWDYSPFNIETPFATADGAFLEKIKDFFTNKQAIKYNRARNRYILARWGAFTNIFGIELWSEINLVTGHDAAYKDESSINWHRDEANYLKKTIPGNHMVTTHFSGDYKLQLSHKKLYQLPELDYVVADAYRSASIPFINHMKKHAKALKMFNKPVLITEYGGSPHAGNQNTIVADIHAGLWSSFFKEQAGTPLLWWHDFIHLKNHYQHYQGFAIFMKGINPLKQEFSYHDNLVFSKNPNSIPSPKNTGLSLLLKTINKPYPYFPVTSSVNTYTEANFPYINHSLGAMSAGNSNEVYGWIYDKKAMLRYPTNLDNLKPYKAQYIALDIANLKGKYTISFFDTMTGELIGKSTARAHAGKLIIKLPKFKIDISFKCKKTGN